MKKLSIGVSLAAIVAVFGVTTAYAYNATSVTYGSALYPLKRGAESVKLSLASRGLSKVQAYLDQASRRMAEAAYLVDNNKIAEDVKVSFIATAHAADGETIEDNLSKTLTDAETSNNLATAETNTITEPAEVDAAVTALQAAQGVQETVLTDLAAKVDLKNDNVTDGIAKALEATKKHHENFDKAKERVQTLEKEEAKKVEEKVLEEEDQTADEAKVTLEEVTAAFDAYKAKKAELVASLSAFPAEKTAKLMERLTNKETKIQEAIDGGNLQQAMGLIKAATALQNNAKHFLAERKNEDKRKDGEEDKRKEQGDNEELKTQTNTNLNTNAPRQEEDRKDSGDDEAEEVR